MDIALFGRVLVTLLVILDPLSNVPIFLSVTRQEPTRRPRAALQATLVAGSVIGAFALFGARLLELLSISVQALQVSGGLVLMLVALELLGQSRANGPIITAAGNAALVPLGTPLLAGPGAIAATIVFIRQAGDLRTGLAVAAALLAALGVVFVVLRFASAVARVVHDNGIELLSRLVGVLLGAIAVQLVAQGVQAWVRYGVP